MTKHQESSSDEQVDLVRRVVAGDTAAFETIVVRYTPSLWSFAVMSLGREDADDAVQETFLRAFRALDSCRESATSLPSWLFRICRNVCMDLKRRSARRAHLAPVQGLESLKIQFADPADLQQESVLRITLQQAFNALDIDEREAFYLMGVLGFSSAEAARVVDAPSSTMRSRATRARRRLAQEIAR